MRAAFLLLEQRLLADAVTALVGLFRPPTIPRRRIPFGRHVAQVRGDVFIFEED